MLILGWLRPLQETDCYKLDPATCDSAVISDKLDAAWERRLKEANEWNAKIETGEIGPGLIKRIGWSLGRGKGKGRMEKEQIWRENEGRKRASLVLACNEVFFRWFWIGGLYKREFSSIYQ